MEKLAFVGNDATLVVPLFRFVSHFESPVHSCEHCTEQDHPHGEVAIGLNVLRELKGKNIIASRPYDIRELIDQTDISARDLCNILALEVGTRLLVNPYHKAPVFSSMRCGAADSPVDDKQEIMYADFIERIR